MFPSSEHVIQEGIILENHMKSVDGNKIKSKQNIKTISKYKELAFFLNLPI